MICQWATLCLCGLATAAATNEELLSAVSSGNAEVAHRLLSSGSLDTSELRFFMTDEEVETTMLHAAASWGFEDVLHALLTAWPAGAQATDSEGSLPLHVACGYRGWPNNCLNGTVAIVQPLLQQWPDSVKVANGYGMLPLHMAAVRGDTEQVRLLLQQWPESVKVADGDGNLPLHWASAGESVEIVQLLLQKWPGSVKVANKGGQPPLHIAAELSSLKLVQLLVEHWPEGLHVVANDGSTALAAAGRYSSDYLQTARWIFERSPSDTPNLNCEVLIELACNTTEASQSWKDAARDLKCLNMRSLSKLHLQCWLDFCGASPNYRDSSGSLLMDRLFDSEAQEFLKIRGTQEELITTTLTNWFSWVVLSSAASTAFAVVYLERLTVTFMRRKGWLEEESVPDKFFESAKLLVGQAFARRVWLLKLWRWLEVLIAVFVLGPSLLLMHWIWWLPLVAFAYVIPAARCHGIRRLVHTPVLAIFTQGVAAQVIGVFRTALFLGIYAAMVAAIAYDTGYGFGYGDGDEVAPPPLLAWVRNLRNPFHESWLLSKMEVWHGSRLHDHWFFEWTPHISAARLYQTQQLLGTLLLALYLACLLGAAMYRCVQLRLSLRPRHSAAHDDQKSHAVRELLKTPKERFQSLHTRINPAMALTQDEFPRKVMPVVAFTWPWQGGGLWQSVAVWLLDVGLDVNTIFTFLAAKHDFFAAVTTFVVVRSTLKQVFVLTPWNLREAVRQSASTGLVRKDLLDMLEEEKRSEAFFCGCITAYSAMFSVDTAVQMLVQLFSTLLSTWLFAGYAVQVCDLDFEMDEEAANNLHEAAPEMPEPAPDVPEPTLHETAQGLPADEMTQKDEHEEIWISVLAMDKKEAALEVAQDGAMSSPREPSSPAPKGPASKACAKKKKKKKSRNQKSKSSKPSVPPKEIGTNAS